MFLLLMALLTIYMFFLPLTLSAEGSHQSESQARLALQLPGYTHHWRLRLRNTASGRKLVRVTDSGDERPVQSDPHRRQRTGMLLSLLRRADKARHFLLRHIRLDALDALILLNTQNAAHTALLSGGLDALGRIPSLSRKHVHIRVLPDFFRGRTTWQARCIIRLRVGTIIITALMLLAAYAVQRYQTIKEAEQWNIPSEN